MNIPTRQLMKLITLFLTMIFLALLNSSTCKRGDTYTTGSKWRDGAWTRYRITYPDGKIEDVSLSITGKEGSNYEVEISTLGRRYVISIKTPEGGIIERNEPFIGQGQVILKKGGKQAMYVPVVRLEEIFEGYAPYNAFEIPELSMKGYGREMLSLPDGTEIETEHFKHISKGKTLEEIWVSPKVPILGIVKRTLKDGTSIMLVDYGGKGAMKLIEEEVLPYDPTAFEEEKPPEGETTEVIEGKEPEESEVISGGMLYKIIKPKLEEEK
ncbi:MAG TPA: hypothetical protein ENG29_00115 [Firmicutes bacterium]|nr:hypothetical protein [Bacillota bacterium]